MTSIPTLPILTAGTAGGHHGYANTSDVTNSPFGSLSNTAAPGGRLITALYFEAADATYIVLDGTGHTAFLNNLPIWINGVNYLCFGFNTTAQSSYAKVSLSQLFVSPNTYTISFTAP